MTHDDLRTTFVEERRYHPDWPESFVMVLSPVTMALLELYFRHPEARRSTNPLFLPPTRRRGRGWRPVAITVYGLDQKQRASGEKPDD